MGDIKFSPEQLKAIELKNSSLMVSAAAGSGKTAVLVERIIRKITEENADIDKLLVVTFTNAAAQGMKKKIKSAIKERLKNDRGNTNLKRQLLLVDKANISTVHSFCLDLIKKYSHLLPKNVPGDFSLLNETEKSLMINQILSEIITDYYEKNDEDFIRLLDCYGSGSNDSKIITTVIGIYNFLVSIPNYHQWVQRSLDLISGKYDFYKSCYAVKLFDFTVSTMRAADAKYDYVLSILEGNGDFSSYYDFFKEEGMYFKNALKKDNLKDLINYIGTINFARLPSSKKSVYTEMAKNIRDTVKEAVKKITEIYSEEIIEINLKNTKDYDIINKLFEIVLVFDEKFKEEKYQSGLLDFNDLEHLTIHLLSDNGSLREEFIPLRDSFFEILVDEYQDTNDVQEMIFSLLKKDNNLFTVGDIKQSIYRFRHANPDLFLNRINLYKNEQCGEIVNLNANYRCHENVVDVVNKIFSFLMSEEISKIDYEENKLIAMGEFPGVDKKKMSSDVKIALMDKDDDEDSYSKEAKIIASSIENMMDDSGFLVDGRRLKYSDITILTRSFNEKTFNLLKELSKYNIPVSYEDKTQFFDTVEIKSFISLLKIVDSPYDDISYISALRNVFSYTDEELLGLRLLNDKKSFYELQIISENKKDKEIIEYIENLRDYARKYDLKSLIVKVYDDTFYVEKQTRFANGSKRKENLERLIDIASEYEEKEYRGLYSFITYIDRIVSERSKISNPKISDNSDTVKVMSIHSSKGLEFPVVILQGMDKKFNRMDFVSDIILSSSLGIGYTCVDTDKGYKYPSVYKNIIAEEEKTELLLEELRILYVALTRAKYKLIMTGCIKKPSKEEWYTKYLNVGVLNGTDISYIDFKGINNYFDMVLPPLLKCKNDDDESEYPENEWININAGGIKIFVYEDVDIKQKEISSFFETEYKELTYEEKIYFDERYNYKYVGSLAKVPKKISVTEAKKILNSEDSVYEHDYSLSIYVPDFKKEARVTSKERGILIHYIFENIDLKLLKDTDNKMKVILDFIENNNYLKDKLTHSDLKKVQAFFESSLGTKMLRAKEVHREKEFLLKVSADKIYKEAESSSLNSEVIVQGIIDCFFVDTKGDIYLIDYKYVSGTEEKIKKEYYYQIELYKDALSKSLSIKKESIKAYIWNVDKEYIIEF